MVIFAVDVQSFSRVWLCDPMDCNMPGFPVLHHLPEFAQAHVHWVDDTIQPSHPLWPPSPLSLNLSQHQGLPHESVFRIRWPKYWSFSFSNSPFNECSGLTPFRMDWFDLLAVQGTLKSLLQHHSLKASILQCPALFMVQLWYPYMITGNTIALTICKVMSLLFNMLSRFLKAFLPRSRLLISWLQSPSTVILEPKKIKSVTISIVSPSICHDEPDAMIFIFGMLSSKAAFSLSSFTFIMRLFSSSLLFGAAKSLQMVTAAMKLKDNCSLEEKLWQT